MDGFLLPPGLPFSNVLTASRIHSVFARHGGLFGVGFVDSTTMVPWVFPEQVLRDGNQASCQTAVASSIRVVTTLTNIEEYSNDDIGELYGFQWNSELDIRSIQDSLNLGHVHSKSPEMVRTKFAPRSWHTI